MQQKILIFHPACVWLYSLEPTYTADGLHIQKRVSIYSAGSPYTLEHLHMPHKILIFYPGWVCLCNVRSGCTVEGLHIQWRVSIYIGRSLYTTLDLNIPSRMGLAIQYRVWIYNRGSPLEGLHIQQKILIFGPWWVKLYSVGSECTTECLHIQHWVSICSGWSTYTAEGLLSIYIGTSPYTTEDLIISSRVGLARHCRVWIYSRGSRYTA